MRWKGTTSRFDNLLKLNVTFVTRGLHCNATKKCIDCPIGKYGNISNTNNQYLPEQQSCALCPNGRYANITGISTECFGCPHGMYGKSDKIGATSTFNGCENCSSGTYGNITGAETELDGCFLCAFGKYSNKIGATNCQNCVATLCMCTRFPSGGQNPPKIQT